MFLKVGKAGPSPARRHRLCSKKCNHNHPALATPTFQTPIAHTKIRHPLAFLRRRTNAPHQRSNVTCAKTNHRPATAAAARVILSPPQTPLQLWSTKEKRQTNSTLPQATDLADLNPGRGAQAMSNPHKHRPLRNRQRPPPSSRKPAIYNETRSRPRPLWSAPCQAHSKKSPTSASLMID